MFRNIFHVSLLFYKNFTYVSIINFILEKYQKAHQSQIRDWTLDVTVGTVAGKIVVFHPSLAECLPFPPRKTRDRGMVRPRQGHQCHLVNSCFGGYE
jgi:hypothetical protein